MPRHALKSAPASLAGAQAIASAVRHLSQREAGFEREALYKAALDFGLPTTIAHVEGATRSLVRAGQLIEGTGPHKGWLASREAIDTETRILAWAAEGRDAIQPGITEQDAETRVQASAQINHGIVLNEGQLGAARLILSSSDRTIAVQGVAGAGKSSVLKPVAEVLREQGYEVLGLAVQNTLVQMLERDTGIRSQSLARFLKDWGRLVDEPGNAMLQADASAILLDVRDRIEYTLVGHPVGAHLGVLQQVQKTFADLIKAMGGKVQGGGPELDGSKAIAPGGSIIHEVGGAIMGADRRTSVTNRWGQAWDVPNLFLSDGAPFASNADKNPTLTIMALAWRQADHIIERFRRKEL